MADTRQLQVSRTVDAPPERVFALLADPSRHAELDGSDMLRGVEGDSSPVSAVGDVFTMNMHHPDLGEYQMRNEVIAFEPDRRIGWAPSVHYAPPLGDWDPKGQTYTHELEPTGDGRTRCTLTYDWSTVTDPEFLKLLPRVSEAQLSGSLDRIAEVAQG